MIRQKTDPQAIAPLNVPGQAPEGKSRLRERTGVVKERIFSRGCRECTRMRRSGRTGDATAQEHPRPFATSVAKTPYLNRAGLIP